MEGLSAFAAAQEEDARRHRLEVDVEGRAVHGDAQARGHGRDADLALVAAAEEAGHWIRQGPSAAHGSKADPASGARAGAR